jgi:hypothetical protein
VTVQLFFVLFFQTKQNLDWAGTGRNLAGVCHDDICGVSDTVKVFSIGDHVALTRALTRKCVPSRLCLLQSPWQFLLGNNPSSTAVSETEANEDGHYCTSVRTCKVRLWILLRPSETIQTTTFFQPSGPQVLERFLLQRWAMFLITLGKDER